MGTHPIFESDFDCLTDADFADAAGEVGDQFAQLEKTGVINICGVDKKGLPMIVVAACRFPLNTSDEHHQLFGFIQAKLDAYVASDYSVVYFHHGYTKANKPSLKYLKQVYASFDRKYKKKHKTPGGGASDRLDENSVDVPQAV